VVAIVQGLNTVLRGVVLAAEKLGSDVVGFTDGFAGLLPPGMSDIGRPTFTEHAR